VTPAKDIFSRICLQKEKEKKKIRKENTHTHAINAESDE